MLNQYFNRAQILKDCLTTTVVVLCVFRGQQEREKEGFANLYKINIHFEMST